MEIIFSDSALLEIYETGTTTDRRYKHLCKEKKFVKAYQRVINTMMGVNTTEDLRLFSFLHYEKLKYKATPISSVRVVNGRVERLLFTEIDNGIKIELIEINTTHYGNKK